MTVSAERTVTPDSIPFALIAGEHVCVTYRMLSSRKRFFGLEGGVQFG